jgi:hypothetical protein
MGEEPQVPTYPRPWYYRPEFHYAMFIFPPVWSVLVLRSPWNQNILLGGVAWAILFIGGFLALKLVQNGSEEGVIALFLPGTLLTIVTQIQWARYRHEHESPVVEGKETALPQREEAPRPARPSARRRSRRRSGR